MHSTLRLAGTGAFLLLALTACGKDLCDRTAKLAEDCGEEISDADFEACKESIAECSGEDEKLLDDYFDCAQDAGLLVCEGETEAYDSDAAMSCFTPLMGLSQACLEGMTSATY